jgi:hypothetical protein
MCYTAKGKTQNLLEVGAVHAEPIARSFSVERLEFLAALRRRPLGHCAERHLIYASFVFKIDAVPARLIQISPNL